MNHHAIPVTVALNESGAIRWNGKSIDEAVLTGYLNEMKQMSPLPFPILLADNKAPCASVHHIRAVMEKIYCSGRWTCGEGHGKWQPIMDLPSASELKRLGDIADNIAGSADKSSR